MRIGVSIFLGASLFKFAAILGDEGFHGPCGGFAERTNGFAVDVVGDFKKQINIFRTAMTVLDAMEHFLHPQRAFAARRALAAGLVRVKLTDVQGGVHNIDLIGQDNDSAAARHRAGFAERFEIKRHIELIGLEHGH